ncbi:MAG: hypothetical protein B6I26_00555 [Desulfobacteraceae bacterium 4572_130]|nr:MAG: hypothetical protein B6I26_00555 [Desulfobacteraceae bacterium 4572_130]
MKYRFIVLILFIISFSSVQNISAQNTTNELKIKYDSVKKKGIVLSNRLGLSPPLTEIHYQPGHWRRTVADDAHVIKQGNKYRMLLSGHGSPPNLYPHTTNIWSLGEATAPHPKGPWTISNNDNPVLAPHGWIGGWGGGHLVSSMYIFDPKEKKGKIIYQCSTGMLENGSKIGRTDDGYPNVGTELFFGKADTIADPYLVHDGKYYHLFYSKKIKNIWQTWKRKALTWQGLSDASSAKCIVSSGGSSSVTKYNGIWYLVYSAWYNAGSKFDYATHKNKIYLWKSKDLENWDPEFNGKPIFEPNAIYDKFGAQDPCLFIENNIMYIYYGGIKQPGNNGKIDTSICLATLELTNPKPKKKIDVSFRTKLFIKGIWDNHWINQGDKKVAEESKFKSDVETELRPSLKLSFTKKISGAIEWKINHRWNFDIQEIEIYRGYLQFYRMFDSPFTLILGRQELSFGRKLLMGEYNGYDGAHLLFNDKDLKVDLFAGTRHSGNNFFDFDKDKDNFFTWDNNFKEFRKNVYGLNLRYNLKILNKPLISEAYIFHKKNNTIQEKTTAIGIKTEYKFTKNLNLNSEITKQTGSTVDENKAEINRNAWGGYVQTIWKHPKIMLKPEFRFEYAYLSGDDPDTTDNENFDILSGDNLDSDIKWGRIRNIKKNMHIGNLGILVFPWDNIKLSLFYSILRKEHLSNLDISKDEGQELNFKADYSINKHLSFNLFAGIFWPGNLYDNALSKPAKKSKMQFETCFELKF